MNKLELAKNPNTLAEDLAELAKDGYWVVRSIAASNPKTSAETLVELAKDRYWHVRSYAASNPNTQKKQ